MIDMVEENFAVLATEEVTAAQAMTLPIVAQAQEIEVVDRASFDLAMDGVKRCKDTSRRVEDIFGPARDKAHKAWKAITFAVKSLTDPLEAAGTMFQRKAYAWRQAETKRIEAESAERERKRIAEAEAERAILAEDLADSGLTEAAVAVLEKPVVVVPEAVAAAPAVEGAIFREKWTFKIIDEQAIPREYLMIDTVKIGKIVRALKGATNIAGVQAWDEGSAAVHR